MASAVLLAAPGLQDAQRTAASQKQASSQMALSFAGKRFLHRHTPEGGHIFSPTGQESLQQWQEMLVLEYEPGYAPDWALSWAETLAQGYMHSGSLYYSQQLSDSQYRILGSLAEPGVSEVHLIRIVPLGEGSLGITYKRRFYGAQIEQEGN